MANYTGKAVALSATMTFGGASFGCKSLPAGVPQTTDLPNVTTLGDSIQKFAASALTEDGEITVVVVDTPPTLNATGALAFSLSVSVAGATASTTSVSVGNCIVTGVEPATLEAGGDRVLTWTVTFRPDGTRA